MSLNIGGKVDMLNETEAVQTGNRVFREGVAYIVHMNIKIP